MMNLKEIRDRLLKERDGRDNYVDGILDMYNAIKKEIEKEKNELKTAPSR
jgi:hypothetical protein